MVMVTLKRHNGFTLTEVLLALGIFTVGFSMMAMALPIAALMQKNTADGIYSNIVAGQSKAIVKGSQLKLGNWTLGGRAMKGIDSRFPLLGVDPDDVTDPAHLVLFPFPDDTRDETALFEIPQEDDDVGTFGILSEPATRSYPIGDLTPRIYWVPLIRRAFLNPASVDNNWANPDGTANTATHNWRTGPSEWQVVIAILKYRSQAKYDRTDSAPNWAWAYGTTNEKIPGLIRVPCTINGTRTFQFNNDYNQDNLPDVKFGHMVIDEFGSVYRVERSDANSATVFGSIPTQPTKLWYAPGSVKDSPTGTGGDSPILDVIVLTSNSANQLVIDNKVALGT